MKLQGWTLKNTIASVALFAVAGATTTSPNAHGAERYEYYSGARQMGMGGAVIAVANDETALITNPAALGKLRDVFFTVLDPEVEANVNVQPVLGAEFYKAGDPQFVLDKTNSHRGDRMHIKSQIFPSLIFPHFGIGLHGVTRTDAQVNEAGTAFEYKYRNDWSLIGGFNASAFGGIAKLGANVKYTNRREVNRDDIDPTSTNLSLDNLAQEGMGVTSDVAVMLAAPVQLLPTLAVVWRDVGDSNYALSGGMFSSTTDRPQTVKNTVDVGFAIFPIHSNRTRSSWTVEVRDVLTDDDNETIMRRLHGGFEMNFADAFFVRGGMNQGYWTAGVELAMFNYQLQAATYGEEIGTDSAKQEDRRYVLKFSLRF